LEETYVKHCLENKEITYYKRYVEDILIIFDQSTINERIIRNFVNNNANNVDLNNYRKPTYIDITIHFSSNHPYGHILVAFNYYINRMITMPFSV
jgi:hypothetical protein